ncbi:MAG: hypothetical protein ABIJ21_05545 [Nanoarchaeota archaeon]
MKILNNPKSKTEQYHTFVDSIFRISDDAILIPERLTLLAKLMQDLDAVKTVEVRSDVVAATKHLDYARTTLRDQTSHKAFREALEKTNLHLFRIQVKLLDLANKKEG